MVRHEVDKGGTSGNIRDEYSSRRRKQREGGRIQGRRKDGGEETNKRMGKIKKEGNNNIRDHGSSKMEQNWVEFICCFEFFLKIL